MLRKDGTLWRSVFKAERVGYEDEGILRRYHWSEPEKLEGLTDVVSFTHNAAVKRDGTLWAWGSWLDSR